MGSFFDSDKEIDNTQVQIDPALAGPSKEIIDALMQIGGVGPMAFMREGPSVAAMTPAQMGAMDATAAASNAFGIPAVSAAQSLPTPNYNQDGMVGYNVAPMVRDQMSPEYQAIYGQLFGPGGMLYRDPNPAPAPTPSYGGGTPMMTGPYFSGSAGWNFGGGR